MKKFLVSMVAALLAVPTFAQYSSGGFSLDESNIYYGVRIGMTAASLGGDNPVYDTKEIDLGTKTGMTLAGIVGLRVSDSTPVFLESGLYYTQRGAKKNKQQVGYNNLDIPILIKYGIKATDDIAVLPFVGPYFSYAFGGTTKLYDQTGTLQKPGTFDEKKWTALSRANMGFKLGVGAEYNKLYLELAYQWGVTNVSKDDDLTIRSNALNINFGINF